MKNINLNSSTIKSFPISTTSDIPAIDNNEVGEFHPKTFDWARYGNNITKPIQLVTEALTNGRSAIDQAIEMGMVYDPRRIEFSHFRDTEGYLWWVCDNSGVPAPLARMMDYGVSTHARPENQHGTGSKTILSANNPEGNHWYIQTATASGKYYIEAPYSENMSVKKCVNEQPGAPLGMPGDAAIWKADAWVSTRLAVRCDDECMFDSITMGLLNKHYTYMVAANYNIFWNGQRVTQSLPGGTRTGGKKQVVINGQNVMIEWDIYERHNKEEATAEYPISKDSQGVYLFVNDVLYTYEDTRIFKKWTVNDGVDSDEDLKPHESMNPFVVLVRITTPANHKADVPFNNHKSEVRWETAIGKEYRRVIDELVGDEFRKVRRAATEREKRQEWDSILSNSAYNAYVFQTEVQVSPYKKEKGVEAADAILATKPLYNKNGTVKMCTRKGAKYQCVDLSTATTILEYKVVPLTPAMVGKAISHHKAIKRYYGAVTQIHFIVPVVTKPAMDEIEEYRAEGVRIVISYHKNA